MGQRHPAQAGTFHITTNAAGRISWCTLFGVPEMLIDNLCMSRSVHRVQLHAFCILPDHVHLIVSVGEKGASGFMHSFKKNSSRDVSEFLGCRSDFRIAATGEDDFRIAATGNIDDRIASAGNNDFCITSNTRSGGSKTAAALPEQHRIRWQKGYHDELIRDGTQRSAALAYVHGNAMKHGLVTEIPDWPWTSLHYRNRVDPMEVWLD